LLGKPGSIRVRRTMEPIRPGAQAPTRISTARPIPRPARRETVLATRIGAAVRCRAAA